LPHPHEDIDVDGFERNVGEVLTHLIFADLRN
jgi:hypothetical protein